MIEDAEHGAVGAVRGKAARAHVTRPAAAIDLADDAASGERTRLCHANKLVPEDALKSHVPLHQLKVGLTDSSDGHLDQYFCLAAFGRRPLRLEPHAVRKYKSSHQRELIRSVPGGLKASGYQLPVVLMASGCLPLGSWIAQASPRTHVASTTAQRSLRAPHCGGARRAGPGHCAGPGDLACPLAARR